MQKLIQVDNTKLWVTTEPVGTEKATPAEINFMMNGIAECHRRNPNGSCEISRENLHLEIGIKQKHYTGNTNYDSSVFQDLTLRRKEEKYTTTVLRGRIE
jgi:hypothetical protein